ncbi:metallophosphoesterase [Blastococcus sp. Marseille-P5729]|uniref:metallophosphoesterase family protein n=1 Tax=Blastococcus sp. Marseille-P5729 TaxID=2086582 RepID=UPI000D110FCB|nr:metallophosphoesterase [Blastococcus sp. Marseille-P5729]
MPDSPRPDDAIPPSDHTAEPADPDVVPVKPRERSDDALIESETVRRRWREHPVARIFARIAVALGGVLIGVLLGGQTTADIGPIRVSAELFVGPGQAVLRIPPLGALEVDAYEGPLRLEMTVLQVDQAKATQYVNGASSLDQLTAEVESDLRDTLQALALRTVGWAIVGGGIASFLMFRRFREALISVGTSVALIVATGVVGYLTFDAKALQQPTYTGLLAQAPAIVGNITDLADKFADYRKSLVKLVTNVSTLYTAVSTLPTDPGTGNTTKVLHVSDIHMNPAGFDLIASLVEQFQIDFVIDTGDLVDWGTPQESKTFETIGGLGIPYVYIRGNHDSLTTQEQVAQYPNVTVLEKSTVEIEGLTIVGVGDPRFSPDRTTYDDSSLDEAVEKSAEDFAEYVADLDEGPDIVLFHDPKPEEILQETGPIVLSGHRHKRTVDQLDNGTLLMVQGSTGGAGLRGLEGEDPTPLTATVLYFDTETNELIAWDDIRLGGLGQTDVSIDRSLAPEAIEEAEESAASITPSESPAPDDDTSRPSGPTSGTAPSEPQTTAEPTPATTASPGG